MKIFKKKNKTVWFQPRCDLYCSWVEELDTQISIFITLLFHAEEVIKTSDQHIKLNESPDDERLTPSTVQQKSEETNVSK